MVKFARDAHSLWTEEEDSVLIRLYPVHGRKWDGWAEALPGRTERAISARASRIGVKAPNAERIAPILAARQREECSPHLGSRVLIDVVDPNEDWVMACMRSGMSPSDIDKKRHWPLNTAKRIILTAWRRDKERHERR